MTALTATMARNLAEQAKDQGMLRQELAKDLINNRVDVYVLTEKRRSGNLMGQYRIACHNGKNYIIFKDYHGLRRALTGTQYLLDNPKVVKMGIGMQAAKGMAKGGVLVTVIFSRFKRR